MKTKKLRTAAIGLSAWFALAAQPALAEVTVTTAQLRDQVFNVSATDLLQTQLAGSSFSGNFARTGSNGAAAFINGTFGTQGFQGGGGEAATADGSNVAIFTLSSSGATGVDIGQIDTYAGWDGNRGGQAYVLSVATVADPGTFITLATVFFNATTAGGNTSTRVTLSSPGGVLASQVHSLRFAFSDGLDFGFAGYREIDVFAASPVPEPASALLLALGGAALLARRARKTPAVTQPARLR